MIPCLCLYNIVSFAVIRSVNSVSPLTAIAGVCLASYGGQARKISQYLVYLFRAVSGPLIQLVLEAFIQDLNGADGLALNARLAVVHV